MSEQATIEARYLGYSQAAAYLGVSVGTLRRMVEAGQVKTRPLGERLVRFDRLELDALIHREGETEA